jgi:hypothetical protein
MLTAHRPRVVHKAGMSPMSPMSKTVFTMLCAVLASVVLSRRYPFPDADTIPVLLLAYAPEVFHGMRWTWYAMLFTTPAIVLSTALSFVYTFTPSPRRRVGKLPTFPEASDDEPLHLVIGEVHHPRRPEPVEHPKWLVIPDRGLFTGLAVIGAIGSGKTTAALYPFAEQILRWRAGDESRRVGGIVLEVKGDFCHKVREILVRANRGSDYIEIGLDTNWRYNPLHNDLDPFAMAYSIATLLNQLYGRGKEPFWQQAYTNLVKFLIILHKVVDDYVTLFDVYRCAISTEQIRNKIEQGKLMFLKLAAQKSYIVIDPMVYLRHGELAQWNWEPRPNRMYAAEFAEEIRGLLEGWSEVYDIEGTPEARSADDIAFRLSQFEAVDRWFMNDWMSLDPKLRSSIATGISVHLSLIDSDPLLKKIFCPPKECFTEANADWKFGRPLPSFAELIDSGKVVALNFPLASNPAVSRMITCMLKQDFQRAMLLRITKMSQEPDRHWREVLFFADEYHEIATTGASDPSGDERFFALSRQAKCIPIVAFQSFSSLKSALGGDDWRTLCSQFRTKLFMSQSDSFSADEASKLCGREERYVDTHSMNEAGQDVRVSALTGKTIAHKAGISINKSLSRQWRARFEPGEFIQLANAQAIALAYDGENAIEPCRVMLKPFYLDRGLNYFEQLRKGLL